MLTMSKAYVCDKCGNTVLLEDDKTYMRPTGMYHLVGEKDEYRLDLCENCVKELFKRVREVDDV